MKAFCSAAALIICLGIYSFKGDIPAYRIYDKTGKETDWDHLIEYMKKQDAVFFGELHDNPIAHWLQLKLTKALYAENKNLVLGAEMFESDQQILMDEYLGGKITEKNFEAEMRLWPNYKTDYKPLLAFAFENKLRFIATNVPRRYAATVSKKGKDDLAGISDDGKKYLCPLPLDVDTSLSGYREIMKMDMGHGTGYNMACAQALKDATMGWFIGKNMVDKGIFLHYNGAYHSNDFQGILVYLKKYKPNAKAGTITTVQQKDVTKLDEDNKGKADFTLVVDEEMTSTH